MKCLSEKSTVEVSKVVCDVLGSFLVFPETFLLYYLQEYDMNVIHTLHLPLIGIVWVWLYVGNQCLMDIMSYMLMWCFLIILLCYHLPVWRRQGWSAPLWVVAVVCIPSKSHHTPLSTGCLQSYASNAQYVVVMSDMIYLDYIHVYNTASH